MGLSLTERSTVWSGSNWLYQDKIKIQYYLQLEKEKGHKILKIVLSRSLRGQLNDLSYAANNWKEVKECQFCYFLYIIVNFTHLKVTETIDRVKNEFGKIDAIWNIGGPEVYRMQLESNNSLENCRSYKLNCHSDNLFTATV